MRIKSTVNSMSKYLKTDSPADIRAELEMLNVSHETIDRLQIYVDLLAKWQARINLVSGQTLRTVWRRHVLDSLQLLSLLPDQPCRLMDIGTGAGLPGLLLAIASDHDVHLVESDERKCAFLRTALRETGAQGQIHNLRVEKLPEMEIDVLTARALAPVATLLDWTKSLHRPGLKCLFLKGRNLTSELTIMTDWPRVEAQFHRSLSADDGQVLELNFMK